MQLTLHTWILTLWVFFLRKTDRIQQVYALYLTPESHRNNAKALSQ
jgi:hypothetical protein